MRGNRGAPVATERAGKTRSESLREAFGSLSHLRGGGVGNAAKMIRPRAERAADGSHDPHDLAGVAGEIEAAGDP